MAFFLLLKDRIVSLNSSNRTDSDSSSEGSGGDSGKPNVSDFALVVERRDEVSDIPKSEIERRYMLLTP
jgi:hypothetical protein